MDIDTYLDRIGIDSVQKPSIEFLDELMEHHLQSIPFENLDVLDNIPIILEEERLYNKLVERKRGGFCFELNGAFAWLLRQLGYSVKLTEAAVYSEEKKEFGTLRNHLVILVDLNNSQYLVDVGFGDSHRKPILLPDGQINDVAGTYRLNYHENNHSYYLQKKQDGEWQPQYYFILNNLELNDYQPNCDWIQNSPASSFTKSRFVTRATPRGRISLSENHFTETRGGNKSKKELMNKTEFVEYLERRFGIDYNF